MKKRLPLLWIPVIFCAVWLVWPDKSVKDDRTLNAANAPTKLESQTSSSAGNQTSHGRNRGAVEAKPFSQQEEISFDSPEVDLLLTDTSVSDDEVARRLRLLVEDSSLPMSSRGEALIHGLTLSIDRFADMAEQRPDLPIELAEIFLAEAMNRNDVPVMQLRTYLAWMNHPEPEIADQSLEQLRFRVGDDNHEENVDRVIEMAIQKINQLKAEEQEPKQPAETANEESPSK